MAEWKLQMPSRPSQALAQVHFQDLRNIYTACFRSPKMHHLTSQLRHCQCAHGATSRNQDGRLGLKG